MSGPEHLATTVVHSELASIVSLLRTTVFLAVLRAEVFGSVAGSQPKALTR